MAHLPMLNHFFNTIPLLSALLGNKTDLKVLCMNAKFRQTLQLSGSDDMEDLSFLEFIPDEFQQDFMKFITKVSVSEKDCRWNKFTILDRNFVSKEVYFKVVTYRDFLITEDQFLLIGLPMDEIYLEDFSSGEIQEGVQKELASKYQTNKYQGIIENANVGIAIFNARGYLEETNPTFADHIGRQKEELLNQHFCHLLEGRVKSELRRLFRQVDKENQNLIKGILRLDLDENSIKILELTISRVFDNLKAQNKYLLISQDITNQQETHIALINSEKLALTGRLAASLAHEINNPLQTSIGCLGLAEEILDENNTELRVYLDMAMQELKRSSRIVKKLRDLNRRADPSEKSTVNLEEILQGLLLLTKNRMVDRNIHPILNNDAKSTEVIASEDQIHQVFLNLLINAIDAMPEGGKINLSLENTEEPDGITVNLRDTGYGMTSDVKNNLFAPFFTTKKDGLGLGLYICKQIIEDHEGKLEVESNMGEGTAFSVWLPQNTNLESE